MPNFDDKLDKELYEEFERFAEEMKRKQSTMQFYVSEDEEYCYSYDLENVLKYWTKMSPFKTV